MHDYHEKFSSITELKVSIMNAFMDHVPATTYFNVGYFLGKQSSKYWIVNKEDLELMYTSMKKKDIYSKRTVYLQEKQATVAGARLNRLVHAGKPLELT